MRRAFIALALVLFVIGAFTGGLAWLLDAPNAPATAGRAERLYVGLCASCHGADGTGSWRAALFLIRPGDLTAANPSDSYVFDVIKHGGAPIGRPGMPAFGAALSDEDIAQIVAYVRGLGTRRP